ncbi:MAG: hypothetical protein GF355_13620, partial [Candidatus Eisenbacteria bacterium]|nr:hypothetical protein [Candidatus Eisenbacteria bacterium]
APDAVFHHPPPSAPAELQPDDPRRDYNVLHYDLTLVLDFEAQRLAGETAARVRIERTTDEIVLDLEDNMVADSAWLDADEEIRPIEFRRDPEQVALLLPSPRPANDIFTVGITYAGRPGASFERIFFSSHGTGADSFPSAASMSENESARMWWACKDVVTDKATVATRITAPTVLTTAFTDTLTAVSNGTLQSIVRDEESGTTTTAWSSAYPISTYLVSVAVSNYVFWEESYTSAAGVTFPLHYYAFPEDSADAREDWSVLAEAMEIFEELYGPYPFSLYPEFREKYGMAEVHFGGLAEEHQTITSYGNRFVTGDHRYDHIVAHELAHMWFGDAVGLAEWTDMWTKEGAATYSEALYLEQLALRRTGSPDSAQVRLTTAMADRSWNRIEGVLADPAPDRYWYTPLTYYKGAWVFHMLRFVMGDELFFEGLRHHLETYRYENASTADLQRSMEEAYGGFLTEFFDQWVYGTGRPRVGYDWRVAPDGGAWTVRVDLQQTQPGIIFTMPCDIAFIAGQEETRDRFELRGAQQSVAFTVPFQPDSIVFDPDGWLLAEFSPLAGPVSLVLDAPAPSPVRSGSAAQLRYFLPGSGAAVLTLHDLHGRELGELNLEAHTGSRQGWQSASWAGLAGGRLPAAGVYWIRLQQGGRDTGRRIVLIR